MSLKMQSLNKIKFGMFLVSTALSATLVNCGGNERIGSGRTIPAPSPVDSNTAFFAATAAALPGCTTAKKDHLYYIADSNEFQFCNGSGWVVAPVKGAAGAKGDPGPSVTGAKGDKGNPGDNGAKGETGLIWNFGDTASVGPTGPGIVYVSVQTIVGGTCASIPSGRFGTLTNSSTDVELWKCVSGSWTIQSGPQFNGQYVFSSGALYRYNGSPAVLWTKFSN